MRRWPLALALLAIASAALGALAWSQFARNRPPVPPTLASLGPLAPEISDIVNQAIKSVEERPRDGDRWGRLGMVCESNGIVPAARDAYATATTLQATDARWWFHLASVEARLGHPDDAVRDMRRATEVNPTFAPAFWRLGLWLLDQNQLEGAERAFNRATEIQPGDRAGWIGLARVYMQRGEHARAAGLLEKLTAAGGGDSYTLQLLGTAYRRLGRNDEALAALGVGVRGEPQWSDAWTDEMLAYRRGYAALLRDSTAYIVNGQFEPAIKILEQLRRTKPDDLTLMAHLGQVYVAAGRDDEGVALLEQVIAREPKRFEAYVDLATGYMHRDRLTQARATVERAVAIEPSFAPAHETRGLALWRGGDARAAIDEFETAAKLDPRNARALVWMAMAQTNLDRPKDALATFRRASTVDPTNADAWIGVANAAVTLHDVETARAALRNAERLQPNRPAIKETTRRLEAVAGQSAGRPK